jgi:F-box-like
MMTCLNNNNSNILSAMLTSLPLDILLLILDHLPLESLQSLRATCKAFLHVIAPRLFSDIHFTIRYGLPFFYYDLSSPSCTAAPYVVRLQIESPAFDSNASASEKDIIRMHLQDPSVSKLHNLETLV